MKKLFTFTLGALLIVSLQSCSKDNAVVKPNYSDAQSTNDLTVPENFAWKTVQEVNLTINPAQSGVLLLQDDKGAVYRKAWVVADNTYSTSINLPAATEEIHVYFNGQYEKIALSGNSLKSTLK